MNEEFDELDFDDEEENRICIEIQSNIQILIKEVLQKYEDDGYWYLISALSQSLLKLGILGGMDMKSLFEYLHESALDIKHNHEESKKMEDIIIKMTKGHES